MTCGTNHAGAVPQAMVDRTPAYERRRKGRRKNQVIGKAGVIRPDKRLKAKFL